MNEVPGNLYSHREQRPSLADEFDRDKHVSPIFGGDLLKQLRAMRRRRTLARRIMVIVALVYAAGMAAFIALLVLRNSADPGQTAAAPKGEKAALSTPTHELLTPKTMRLSVQQWKDSTERLREARVWIQKGRHDTASALLQGLLASNPNHGEALLELAQIYFQQGADVQACSLLQRLLTIEPQRKLAAQMLATLYSRASRHEQALVLANWILDVEPDATEAHRVAGLAYLQTNRLDLALVHFRKWVTAEPDNLAAQKQYADVLLAQGELEKARAIYEAILKKKPEEADAYRQLAICYARQTLVEQSVSTMIQAIYVIGASKVSTWFKDPGFASVRHQKLFALLEKQVTTPQISAHVVPQAGMQMGPNANFDLRRLEQVQAMLKAHY